MTSPAAPAEKEAPFPLFLAPMAGVTNSIFRSLCKQKGADILTSEFVSAEGIMHRNARTREYLEFAESERPMGVQLFGADPERLGEAARQVIDWVSPDFIDINFGCPANKVVCRNGGSSLLRDRPLLERVADAVVKACAPLPVTAKIRIGWDANSVNAIETARLLEGVGVTRIAVHGRTRAQGYSGNADWEVIAAVARSVSVPVIGNGDISCAEDALLRRQCGVSGLMIGRAAMSNPWIFTEIKCAFTGEPYSPPTLADRWEFILRHAREETARRGELHGMRGMRGRLMAYTRGLPGGRHLRGELAGVSTLAALEELGRSHLEGVASGALQQVAV